MAEATLSLEFADFQAAVGRYLGFGRVPGSFDADQLAIVDKVIQEGYARFLAPPQLPAVRSRGGRGAAVEARAAWQWSFLRPINTITAWADIGVDSGTTVSGVKDNGTTTVTASAPAFYPEMVGREIVITGVGTFTITAYTSSTVIVVSGDASAATADTFSLVSEGLFRMVDTFGGVDGRLTYDPDDGWESVVKRSEGQIRAWRQTGADTVSRPKSYALVPITHDATIGQRWDMWLYPIPDGDYVLSHRMVVFPNKLSTTNKWPRGGTFHSRTIEAFCLWEAEETENNIQGGIQAQKAMRRLAQSIDQDVRQGTEYLGYMGDASLEDPYIEPRADVVTFNGTEYE